MYESRLRLERIHQATRDLIAGLLEDEGRADEAAALRRGERDVEGIEISLASLEKLHAATAFLLAHDEADEGGRG
jgi:hypothetical protein